MSFPADAPTEIMFQKEAGSVIFDDKITETVETKLLGIPRDDQSSTISAQPDESVCKKSDRETAEGLSQGLESVKISSKPVMQMGYYDDGELEEDDGMIGDEEG
ncbi:hypothetical protein LINGRAHAP2_LOCUS36059, partial [Linum grandiflorum]